MEFPTMKLFRTVLLSTAAGIAAAVPAQEAAAPAKPPAAQAPTKSAAQLVQELGSDSYRTRTDAEKALRQMGEQVVPELKKAAAQNDDPEVQWRARRVLRQIERGGDGQLEQRTPRPDGGGGDDLQAQPRGGRQGDDAMRHQFESLFERFERDFGIDIPRARFFHDDFFKDLQEQMKAGASGSQSMSMKVGPDGVRVEVEEKGQDGKSEKKVYEAPDMETFQQKYPDVLRRNGLGMGLLPGGGSFFFNGQPPQGGQLPGVFRWNGQGNGFDAFGPQGGNGWRVLTPKAGQQGLDETEMAPVEPPPAPPAGKRLGVQVRNEIPDAVREYVGLGAGEGLWVDSVQDDSLAQALGLQQGDIVVKIGAHSIGSPQDVQQALGGINKGDQVEVQFVRKGERKTASAAKTEAVEPAKDDAKKAEGKTEGDGARATDEQPAKKSKAGRLERRSKKDETIR
jgi:hypothetical protein